MPMPLSRTEKIHSAPARAGGRRGLRGASLPPELDGVADQVLEDLGELDRVGRTVGSGS